jgi:NTE family protein
MLVAILIFILEICPFNAMAQSQVNRPMVGLVLSGGGACGLAHVGILKVMEEAGLRPDLITGVSMGSLIGSLYSIGYTSDSLKELIDHTDWDLLLQNRIPENDIVFPEKRHFNNSIISLPVSFSKVKLPTALINSQQIDKMLSFYLWPAADISDFSKLPIPFQCLATDLETCKKVVLKSGYLPDAIRASIAVPSFFEPFRIDSLLLIDGGLLCNFPVSEVKDMGAGIIIGSYTGAFLHKEKDLKSAIDILAQIGFFTSYYDYIEQKKLTDLTIVPPLKDISSTNFNHPDSMIEIGYRAALPYKDYFHRLADSLDRLGPGPAAKTLLGTKYYSFDKIEIHANRIYTEKQILGILNIKPGEKIDQFRLSRQIDMIYSRSWFDRIKYHFINRNDSMILSLDCFEKPRSTVYGSVHYDLDLKFGVVAGLTARNLLTKRSIVNIDSYVGQYYRINADYLQYLDRQEQSAISANIYADNTMIPLLEIENELGRYLSRYFSAGVSVSRRFGLNHLLRLSGYYDIKNLLPSFSYSTGLKRLQLNYLSTTMEYSINTLDHKYFPDKGLVMNLSTTMSKLHKGLMKTDSNEVSYQENINDGVSFKPFYSVRRITFSISGNLLYISDSDSISEKNNYYMLGGLYPLNRYSIPMTGFRGNEFPVRKIAGMGLEVDIEIIKNFHLNLNADVFGVRLAKGEAITLFTGLGFGAGYMTVIGPINAGLMYGHNNQIDYLNGVKSYLSIGYNF